ncbi:MAG TPA: tRNA lysidine(34) synthetase TilS [Alphaproteobacteria bacterium]|nr:tRNA lysidine(34) synthetase TilS [Rhodospirillaceae bacterium]HRJ12134.1 tRNA lysidine(34) synthetase TilS [Alphaproteobacteria bacterium]
MFEKNARIAVAVSGGPDSMALLHLMYTATKNIVALTVDHGLRKESMAEAKTIAAWCQKHKITHHILKWRGEKPKTAVHEAARTARYDLLQNWCRKNKILHLATAHHADDNAETILQRIAKASGTQGLAGMQEHTFLPHLHIWRPLLLNYKSELVAYCAQYKIPFAQDASNDNPKFARGRLRGAADVLSAEGLTTKNLNLLAQKQFLAAQAIENQAAEFLANYARLVPKTESVFTLKPWQSLPDATAQHVLDYVLKLTSGAYAPIRSESLGNLRAMLAGNDFRAKTLGHCRIHIKKTKSDARVIITPEAARG